MSLSCFYASDEIRLFYVSIQISLVSEQRLYFPQYYISVIRLEFFFSTLSTIYSAIMALYNIIIPYNIKSNDSINGSISFFKPIIKLWKRQSYIWTLIYNVRQSQILQLSTRIQEIVLQGTDTYVTMSLSSRGDTILIYRRLRLFLEKLVIWILIYTTWYQTLLNISVSPQLIRLRNGSTFMLIIMP